MSLELAFNSRFKTITAQAGAAAADADPNVTAPDEGAILDPGGKDLVMFYWTGDTPGGNVDSINVWVYHKDEDIWVLMHNITGTLPNVLTKANVYGASRVFLQLATVTSACCCRCLSLKCL